MDKITLAVFLIFCCVSPTLARQSKSRTDWLKREITKSNSFIKSAETRQAKYEKMMDSPFAFFRATNRLFFLDLKKGTLPLPKTWEKEKNIQTWIQGDFHIQNLGFFDLDGKVVFDLNDFDEAYVAPFYYDLVRFITSIYLISDELGFEPKEGDEAKFSRYFLDQYLIALREKPVLLEKKNLTGAVAKRAKKLRKKKSVATLLDKWTVVEDEKRLFDPENEKLEPLEKKDREIITYWKTYLRDVGNYSKKHPGYFAVKDRVQRLYSGLGSLGVRKYYVLVEGPTSSVDDDVILEVKEQTLPTVLSVYKKKDGFLKNLKSLFKKNRHKKGPARYKGRFSSHADRAKVAHQAMLSKVDPRMGVLKAKKRTYLVRPISPYKWGYEGEDFERAKDFKAFLKDSARALAYAHGRADKNSPVSLIPYSFNKSGLKFFAKHPKAFSVMIKAGKSYSAQVQKDYMTVNKLVNSGKLK